MAEKKASENELMEKIVSLAKRRGFIYQGSEIYGGLAGTWDYGPLGVTLKRNITGIWWKMFVTNRDDMFGIDAAILMNPKAWEASGHVSGFSDPLVECAGCKQRDRADVLYARAFPGAHILPADPQEQRKLLNEANIKCPAGGVHDWSEPRQFNMMFKTSVGAMEDSSSVVYLRPETAGGMFVNFKNVLDSLHPKLPFGLAQIGKAFRNEITPRDFIFRVRELEQMEIEFFVKPEGWEEHFEAWRKSVWDFIAEVGIKKDAVHELEVADGDRAHYSKRTIDFEFDFPFGKKELFGLAYRTDFDLSAHSAGSGQDLSYFDEETKERVRPHVIEPSFGVERTVLAILASAYCEDEMNGEKRTYLKLSPQIAPYRVAVSPLLKNKPELVAKAREVYTLLQKEFGSVAWDDNGNIGKRYRRQDEIGTPACVTIDFDTLGEKPELLDTVTVRDRDTGEQVRVAIAELLPMLRA